MNLVRDPCIPWKACPITYKTFRCLFNKRTCPDLAGVEIIAPEEKLPSLLYANISRTDIDDRLISMIDFSIVEKECPRGEKGIRATVYLAAQNNT